jgi:hypothetical protein
MNLNDMNTTTKSPAMRAIRRVALPAAAAAGAITFAVTSGLPTVLGSLPLNHNETLLRADRP